MRVQALTQQGEQLRKGEQAYKSKDGVMALAYKDKRVVLLLNTAYSASEGTTIKQLTISHNNNNNIPPTYTHIPAPLAVAAYRQYMGGVDRFTSFLAYYICGFRSSKWWLRLTYQLIDIAIVNAFIISKQSPHTANKWRTQKEFRLDLFTALVNNTTYRKQIGRPTNINNHNNNIHNNSNNNNNIKIHLIKHVDTSGNCAYCYNTQKKYKQCKYICTSCINKHNSNNVYLHADCFHAYHT